MASLHADMPPSVYVKLEKTLGSASKGSKLYQQIVNAPFKHTAWMTQLSLGIIVLLLVDKKTGQINRVALSETESAKGAVDYSVKEFKQIKIPLGYEQNIIATAIRTGRPQQTADWQYLFTPDLTAEEARFNQAGAGIGCSCVYPFDDGNDGGALIFSYYQTPEHLTLYHEKFMTAYSAMTGRSLSRQLSTA